MQGQARCLKEDIEMITVIKKSVQQLIDAWNSHDPERIIAYYSDDIIYNSVGTGTVIRGKKELRKYLVSLFKIFPDVKYEFRSSFKAGDRSATEWTMSGTDTAHWPGFPPPSGKRFSTRGVSITQYQDNKIFRETEYWNIANIFIQGGQMPATVLR